MMLSSTLGYHGTHLGGMDSRLIYIYFDHVGS